MLSWADRARANRNAANLHVAMNNRMTPEAATVDSGRSNTLCCGATSANGAASLTVAVRRGCGLVSASIGRVATDVLSIVFSFCDFISALHLGYTCVQLRSLSLLPRLWDNIREMFDLSFEMEMGHAAPSHIEFCCPVDMSCTVRRRAGSMAFPETISVSSANEAAAEFVRYRRFVSKSKHRRWQLEEMRCTLAAIALERYDNSEGEPWQNRNNNNDLAARQQSILRLGFVNSFDPSAVNGHAVPLTVTAVRRTNDPYLHPADISTVFSHAAANAMGACRLETWDVSNTYSEEFLQRLGRALGSQLIQKGVGRVLASAALIEISLPEALRCVQSYPSRAAGEMATMLLNEVTIDANESRYFAIRQFSSEAHIGIVFVDPILTIVIGAGTSLAAA